MSYFNSEKEMHEWITKEIQESDGLYHLINNKEILEKKSLIIEHKLIKKSFNNCLESINHAIIISNDENISTIKNRILRPDLILFSYSTEGIVIVEIKNIKNPTRELGTEVSAYAAEVKHQLPFLSDRSIYTIVISNYYPALLRSYLAHDIIFNNRNILCLRPTLAENSNNCNRYPKLLLDIYPIELLYKPLIRNYVKLSYKEVTGFHVSLNNYQDSDPRMNVSEKNIAQIKTSLILMKNRASKIYSHGFILLWENNDEDSLAPYIITICNLSPFEYFNKDAEDTYYSKSEKTILQDKFSRITDYFFSPSGHSSTLFEILESGEFILKKFSEVEVCNSNNWKVLYSDIRKQSSKIISFYSWGIIEKSFNDFLMKDYEKGKLDTTFDDPILGLIVLESMIDVS